MKLLSILAVVLIASAAFGQSRTPIRRGYLQTNLNGNQQSITNVNNIQATGTVTASNFVHTTWKWLDLLVSGQAVASNPAGFPPSFTAVPGQNYFGYGYYFNDRSYFEMQGSHKLATTNSIPGQENLYFEPHIHVSTTNITSGTNATFSVDLYYGPINGYLTNYYSMTNSTTLTNTYGHYILNFGSVTNNALVGRSSVIWRGRIVRRDGGAGDIGAFPVWVDSLDIHVPVQELGTIGIHGD